MKKHSPKLELNRETLRRLEPLAAPQLGAAAGGVIGNDPFLCTGCVSGCGINPTAIICEPNADTINLA